MKMFLSRLNQIIFSKVPKVTSFENNVLASYPHVNVTFKIIKRKVSENNKKLVVGSDALSNLKSSGSILENDVIAQTKIPAPMDALIPIPTAEGTIIPVPAGDKSTSVKRDSSNTIASDPLQNLLAVTPNKIVTHNEQDKEKLKHDFSHYIIRIASDEHEQVKIANELWENKQYSTALYNYIQEDRQNLPKIYGIPHEQTLVIAQGLTKILEELLGCVDTSQCE